MSEGVKSHGNSSCSAGEVAKTSETVRSNDVPPAARAETATPAAWRERYLSRCFWNRADRCSAAAMPDAGPKRRSPRNFLPMFARCRCGLCGGHGRPRQGGLQTRRPVIAGSWKRRPISTPPCADSPPACCNRGETAEGIALAELCWRSAKAPRTFAASRNVWPFNPVPRNPPLRCCGGPSRSSPRRLRRAADPDYLVIEAAIALQRGDLAALQAASPGLAARLPIS